MNNKKLIIGICAIVAVGAIFILSEKLTSIRPPEHRTKFFPDIEERHITAITVHDNGKATRLVKRDGMWMVGDVSAKPESAGADDAAADTGDAGKAKWEGGAAGTEGSESFSPAEPVLIQIAVERIASLKKGDLVSENPENRAKFGIEDDCKSFVEFEASGKTGLSGVLLIGKNGPDWNTNYIRLRGSDAVYLASGGLRQCLFLGIEQWRKKPDPVPEVAGPGSDDGGGEAAVEGASE